MYFSLLLFSFFSFLTTNLFGRYIGVKGSAFLATTSIILTFLLSLVAFYECAIVGSSCTLTFFPWFSCGILSCFWGFYFDSISTLMLLVVSGVSALVHLYSVEYMSHDPHQIRFMGYLSLFTFFMLLLVTADNFVIMFLGWEGIGLASFLLISFWSNRIQAGKSAIKAMLVNRVGDLGLVLAICSIFLTFKSLDYLVVFGLTPCSIDNTCSFFGFTLDRLTFISGFLFFGAVGKSAQVGLHIWLPDAMEGPTPVSALIHAATLVTAGVFLIIRCSILFENSHSILLLVTIVGSITAFFASSVGVVQNDFKRVIAYSTCSQLGYMVFSLGLSNYSVSLFHLANHAVFKALLFLSAGCIIHGLLDEQDLRKMGGLIRFFPLSYSTILIGSLALTGFPFLTGFYSKDVILELAFAEYSFKSNFAYYLGSTAAFFTSFYSFRLVYLAFVNNSNSFKVYIQAAHDAPLLMCIPLIILSFGSIFWGYLSRDMIIGLGTPLFFNNLYFSPFSLTIVDSEFISAFFKNIPFIFTILGAVSATLIINSWGISKNDILDIKLTKLFRTIYTFLSKKWHFDQIINELITHKVMNFGYSISFQLIDKGSIEFFGATSAGLNFSRYSNIFSSIQTGFVFDYSFAMILGSFILISCLVQYFFVVSMITVSFVMLLLGYFLIVSFSKDTPNGI